MYEIMAQQPNKINAYEHLKVEIIQEAMWTTPSA